MEVEKKANQVVFIPVPGLGHLLPKLELARRLFRHDRRLAVTFLLIPPLHPTAADATILSSLPSSYPSFSFYHLPHLPVVSRPRPQSVIAYMLDQYKPLMTSILVDLRSAGPISAVVLDFFCSNMVDPCLELNLAPYVFFTSSASMLALMLHAPAVDGWDSLSFPAFASRVPFAFLPDEFVHGKDEVYEIFVGYGDNFRRSKGILVNTFDALQRGVLEALEKGVYGPAPAVVSVGPVICVAEGEEEEKGHECLQWLDRQPGGSVVFLCFGSRGCFGKEQAREVAAGLERSGQRFLWVLRAPPAVPGGGGIRDAVLEELLPDGFLGRTDGRGLVWPSFAPQREVLRHPAVGGFVTHCGWNSILEGIWSGVPMAAWPLYAEQHWNAWEMAAEIGIAVEVEMERWKGNWVTSAEVERAVRLLMGEGSAAVRRKIGEMREEARRAVAEGGSSDRALAKLAAEWAEGDQNQ